MSEIGRAGEKWRLLGATTAAGPDAEPDIGTLEEIQRRILWLAVRMVDEANRIDPARTGGIKIGGHQASSASMVSIMTALWFAHIGGEDKVAVKPHASPVYHAIKYLTGELDRSYLTRLRRLGGLQAYPSRTKDPDVADFSTGSVGLGAVAPLFSAATRRYLDSHFEARPSARFVAIAGDAELDEGNVWEAVAEPALQGLGNVTLVVDLNRQSLDRVVPGIKAERLRRFFADSGWHVVEAKYGHRLQELFDRPGGESVRRHIDRMPNERYQSLFALDDHELRHSFCRDADPRVCQVLDPFDDTEVATLVKNLGGHDLGLLIEAFRECDSHRNQPSVLFAYTIKGWGLPIAGDPMNHSALLSAEQIDDLRAEVGLTPESEWDRFPPESPAGRVCARVGAEVNNQPPGPRPRVPVPNSSGYRPGRGPVSTQVAFGRILTRLGDIPEVSRRLVTTSPDVSVSTGLGGWINKKGVFSPRSEPVYEDSRSVLRWEPGPGGQHVELGISEMNLFLLLGQMGLAHEHHGEMLLPVGTVYDPFVLRGLDALVYSAYNGARFILVGTPSGVTLAPEGGAHQSTTTPSVGTELPGLGYCEPAFARSVDWLLCDGLRRLAEPGSDNLYLRLSTRPVAQDPLEDLIERVGEDRVRSDTLAGAVVLAEGGPTPGTGSGGGPGVNLVASGVMVVEALEAGRILGEEGVAWRLIDVTSPGRLYRDWRASVRTPLREGRLNPSESHLLKLVPEDLRSRPVVTVHDAATHNLSWIGSALGTRLVPVGVDRFGESGTIPELYEALGLTPGHIVNAALSLLS